MKLLTTTLVVMLSLINFAWCQEIGTLRQVSWGDSLASITLPWNTPYDTTGLVSYEIKYCTDSITETNWDYCSILNNMFPAEKTSERIYFTGLPVNEYLYFGCKANYTDGTQSEVFLLSKEYTDNINYHTAFLQFSEAETIEYFDSVLYQDSLWVIAGYEEFYQEIMKGFVVTSVKLHSKEGDFAGTGFAILITAAFLNNNYPSDAEINGLDIYTLFEYAMKNNGN